MRRRTLLLALWAAALLGVAATRPASAVTVSITPADTTVFLGDSFTLRVTVDAVADLKGFEIIHTFDPAVLGFTGQTAGDVLTASGRPFADFLLPDVTAPVDSVATDAAMLLGSSSGPGILVFVHFTASHLGDSAIDCAGVELRDSFNVPLGAVCTGGLVHVTSRPTPALRSSWGALKLHHR